MQDCYLAAGSEQADIPGKDLFKAGGSPLTHIQLVPRLGGREDCSDGLKNIQSLLKFE